MSRYRRIRIRTATREVLSIPLPAEGHEKTFCSQCDDDVGWLGLSDAATVCQMTARELVTEIESGRFHFRNTADGQLRICRVSILKEKIDNSIIG